VWKPTQSVASRSNYRIPAVAGGGGGGDGSGKQSSGGGCRVDCCRGSGQRCGFCRDSLPPRLPPPPKTSDLHVMAAARSPLCSGRTMRGARHSRGARPPPVSLTYRGQTTVAMYTMWPGSCTAATTLRTGKGADTADPPPYEPLGKLQQR